MRRLNYSVVALVATAVLASSGCGGKSASRSAGTAPRPASKFVAVPRVPKQNVIQAYRSLHEAGFRVAIRSALFSLDGQGDTFPYIRTRPASGTVIRRGQTVTIVADYGVPRTLPSQAIKQSQRSFPDTLTVYGGTAGTATIRIKHGPLPAVVKLPDFVHSPLSQLDRWLKKRGYTWIAYGAPALPASNRPQLLDNYLVVKQTPAPGGVLTPLLFPWVIVDLAVRAPT